MSKHTPGPWGYREREAGRAVRFKRAHWEIGSVAPHGGVAIVFQSPENAALVAAAPDLLAACKVVSQMFRRQSKCPVTRLGDDEHQAWNAVNDAIAKAEGTAQ